MSVPLQIGELGPRSDRPRLNSRADLTVHKLSPTEAFVLSRVDGTSSYEQICMVSSLGIEPTLVILRRLKRDGLIVGPKDPMPTAASRSSGTPVMGVPTRKRATDSQPPTTTLLDRLDDHSIVDPIDLLSGPELLPELKVRIIRLHRRLKQLGPYEILGLRPGVDRSEIKRAYFTASKEVHPDRYYGKDIGTFREKLGDIFARVTEAFQALDKNFQSQDKKK